MQRFLHGTWLGRKTTAGYLALTEKGIVEGTGFAKVWETKKLKGGNSPFWTLSSTNIKNYDTDFMALTRDRKIKLHVANISYLSEKRVNVTDGTLMKADGFICAIGWNFGTHMKFLPEGIDRGWGQYTYPR